MTMHDFAIEPQAPNRPESGLILMDLGGNVVSWSAGLETVLGIKAQDALGASLLSLVPDLKACIAALHERRRFEPQDVEVTVLPGSAAAFCVQCEVEGEPIESLQVDSTGGLAGWIHLRRKLTARPESVNASSKNTSNQVEKLQSLMALLSRAITPEDIASCIIGEGIRASGADAVAGVIVDGDFLKTMGIRGYQPTESVKKAGGFPLSSDLPLSNAVRTGTTIILRNAKEFDRYPVLKNIACLVRDKSFVAVPVKVEGRAIGALGFGFRDEMDFDLSYVSFLETFAGLFGQAFERARLFQREREARAKIEFERSRLYSILEQIPAAIAIVAGSDLKFEFVNSAYKRRANNREDLVGLPLFQAHPELAEQPIREITKRVYEQGESFVDSEYAIHMTSPEGGRETKYLTGMLLPWRNKAGEIEGVLSYTFEVTEQVVVRKQVEASEARLKLATESALLGVWDWDAVKNEFWSAGRYAQIFGYDTLPSDWDLRAFLKHVHPDDLDRAVTSGAYGNQDPEKLNFVNEWKIQRTDGQTRWIFERGQVFRDSSGKIVRILGVIHDITERKLAESELRRARDEAQSADRAKTAFVANMSHEFRTPLSAIIGYNEFLARPDLSPQKHAEYVEGIRRNGRVLLKLVEDILDLSRVESGRIPVEYQMVDVVSVVNDVTSIFSEQAQSKGIQLVVYAGSTLQDSAGNADRSIRIGTDPLRLRQILINLVGNALKFTETGSVEVTILKRIEQGDLKGVDVRVKDSGIGISIESAGRLFQPFMQADQSTRRRFGGTGLGLFISRRLAQALDGNVILEDTQPGVGSVFVARIANRVLSSRTEGISPFATEPSVPSVDLAGRKVLVVEDTEDLRELLTEFLETRGAQVTKAKDGIEGVNFAKEIKPDIILMDLHMPLRDGITAVQILRAGGYRGLIVAITARAQPEDRARCFESGFDAYLTKPVSFVELGATLRRLLRRN